MVGPPLPCGIDETSRKIHPLFCSVKCQVLPIIYHLPTREAHPRNQDADSEAVLSNMRPT